MAPITSALSRNSSADRPRAWRALHLSGSYFLWAQLMVSFGKRVPAVPLYTLFLIPLLAVMAVRLIAMASSRSPRMARAS
jgi:methionine sulfoxide reductase heme-binding subunit